MTFAENLKMLRKQAGMSQEQLAEKLGVSRQAVTNWETGASQSYRNHLQTYAYITSNTENQ